MWDYRPGPRRGLAIGAMTAATAGPRAGRVVDAAMSERGAARDPLDRRARARPRRPRAPDRHRALGAARPGALLVRGLRRPGRRRSVGVAVRRASRRGPGHGHRWPDRPAGAVVPGRQSGDDPDGPRAGERAIDGEERLARSLLASLTPAERAIAVVDPVAPPDILSGNGRRADVAGHRDRHPPRRARRAGPGRPGGPDPPLPRAGPRRRGRRRLGPDRRGRPPGRHASRGPARTSPVGATTTRSAGRGSSSSTTTPRTARTTSTRSGATWPTTGARTPSPRTTAPAITPRDRPPGAGQPAYAAGATPIANRTQST